MQKKKVEVSNMGISFGRQPSRGTLVAMYGGDEPIGYYATQRYSKALESYDTTSGCKATINACAKIIVDYAIDLHETQDSYADVSPFGGLDIDVEPIDKIALRETSREDIRNAIVQELVNRRINFAFCKKTVHAFETMQKEASGGLQAAYDKWTTEDKKLQDEIVQAVEDRVLKGETLYNQATEAETAFRNKSWLYRISHREEYKDIQAKKEASLSMIATTADSPEIMKKFDFRIDEHLNNAPYVARFNGVEMNYEYIDSQEALDKAINEAQKYCSDPQNLEEYTIARDALYTAERCKVQVKTIGNDSQER